MPKDVVYVGRPTRYGNPFEVGEPVPAWARHRYGVQQVETAAQAVALFRRAVADEINRGDPASDATADMIVDLRGKDLACWCPLDQPCHADVLLELANLPARP